VYVVSTSGRIFGFRIDPATGALAPRGAWSTGSGPDAIAIHPRGTALYVAQGGASAVAAFRIEDDGALASLGQVPSGGGAPAHVAVDGSGAWLLVANYLGNNVTVRALEPDGRLGAVADTQRPGNNPHFVQLAAEGAAVLVPCKGSQHVAQYRFDPRSGKLTPRSPPRVSSRAGAGPRQMALHPLAPLAFVVDETSSTTTAHRFDRAAGLLGASLPPVSNLPAGYGGANTSAHLEITPDGRFLFASNRGHDSLAAFRVEEETGALAPVGHFPTGGREPGNFVLTQDGAFVVASNLRSNSVSVLRIDPASGRLTLAGPPVSVPSPSGLAVAAPARR
jgi:6-phosphogluconolactonase